MWAAKHWIIMVGFFYDYRLETMRVTLLMWSNKWLKVPTRQTLTKIGCIS